MARESSVAKLSALSAPSLGVFRGRDAVEAGVRRKQHTALIASGVIDSAAADSAIASPAESVRERALPLRTKPAANLAAAPGAPLAIR